MVVSVCPLLYDAWCKSNKGKKNTFKKRGREGSNVSAIHFRDAWFIRASAYCSRFSCSRDDYVEYSCPSCPCSINDHCYRARRKVSTTPTRIQAAVNEMLSKSLSPHARPAVQRRSSAMADDRSARPAAAGPFIVCTRPKLV